MNMGKMEIKDLYFFYKGLAYYRMKDFSRCLYAFENVKEEICFSCIIL